MPHVSLRRLSKVVLLFGVACYLTSCAMDFEGGVDLQERVPAGGGTVGPFEVEDAGTVLGVTVQQQIGRGQGRRFRRWSFVTAELLDADREYLNSFGGEFWHEAGYDEGYWRERDASYQTKLTIPEAGRYFLRLETESSVPESELSEIYENIEGRLGSSLPFHVAALLSFAVGGVLWFVGGPRSAAGTSSFQTMFDP